MNDTRSVSPDADELAARVRPVRQPARRPLGHVVQPRGRGVHARGRRRDRGAAADPARGLRGAEALGGIRRRRLARGVRGDARAVPLHVARRPRLDLAGATRGRVPPVRVRVRGRDGRARAPRRADSAPARARRRDVPADRLPGRLRLRPARPGAGVDRVVRGRGCGGRAGRRASCGGDLRSRPAPRSRRRRSSSRCSAAGSSTGTGPTRPRSRRSRRASSKPCATRSSPATIVFSDSETSFRLAAFAPVYIAVAPPGHVADTEENRPYERARDARRFLRTGDLSIPRGYGAEYVVVDGLRTELELDLPVVYADERFTLYRL